MINTNRMGRWQAGAVHLLVSAIAIGAIAVYVWLRWTPNGLWAVAGVDRPLLTLFAAVLVLGPAMTTLVFRAGKHRLRSDLIVVIALQLMFVAYGLWMLARTRPVFLVASTDRFEIVFANDIDPADLAQAREPYKRLSWTGPRLVGLNRVSSFPGVGHATFLAADTTQQPAYYTDFEAHAPLLLARSRPLDELIAQYPDHHKRIEHALRRLGRDRAQTRFVPVTSRRKGSAVMLIDAGTSLPLHTLPLDPWKAA